MLSLHEAEAAFTWPDEPGTTLLIDTRRGVIDAPVQVRCGGHELGFGGFGLRLGGHGPEGWRVEAVEAEVEESALRLRHFLRHPDLPRGVEVTVAVMTADTGAGERDGVGGAIRFQVETTESGLHLDLLTLRDHFGAGIAARRLFLGKQFVIQAPIEPFDTFHSTNLFSTSLTRYWAVEMANGVTEAQVMDSVPWGFVFDGKRGRYDMQGTCDSPLAYTFVFSARGAQDALSRLRQVAAIPASATVAQIAGRPAVMTWHPIPGSLDGLVEEFRCRGVRDVFWVAYSPFPGDAERIEAAIGGRYTPYDCYVCYFDAESDGGKRACKQWRPEDCEYRQNGSLRRGYHRCTHLLPERYLDYATTREMMIYCMGDREEIVLPTPSSHLSNLKDLKEQCRPRAIYLDVHSSTRPAHYFDSTGRHHSIRDFLQNTARLFDFARDYLGGAVIFSESGGEWLVGPMDGGMFHDVLHSELEPCGLRAADWELYPLLEQVHREHHLAIGFDHPEPGAGWQAPGSDYRKHVSHHVLCGRPAMLVCYWGSDLSRLEERCFDYFLTAGLSRALGLSPIEAVEFDGDDIHRPVVRYGNGIVVRVNRAREAWEVEGYALPPFGYLATGPNLLQVHCLSESGAPVDVVECPEYRFYACPEPHDFGPIRAAGAVALRATDPTTCAIHVVQRLRSGLQIEIDLARAFPDTAAPQLESLRAGYLFRGEAELPPVAFPRPRGSHVRFYPVVDPTVRYYTVRVARRP